MQRMVAALQHGAYSTKDCILQQWFLHADIEAASVHVWQGPVLRSIQRFGRLGKRSGNVPPEARHSKDKIKEAKYMYLSIDEAGTHVNVRRFRCNTFSSMLPLPLASFVKDDTDPLQAGSQHEYAPCLM